MEAGSHHSRADSRKWLLLLVILTAVYSFAYLLWFWGTPLGELPVLDGRENIALATQVSEGALPKEPFFRSMAYPAFLSLFAGFVGSDGDMLTVAGILGVFCHLCATAAVYQSGLLVWRNRTAAFLSGLLFGLHPIGVYFAAEPLDTTFSLSFAVIALWLWISAIKGDAGGVRPGWRFIGSGLALSIAFLARPNFLPILILLPLVTGMHCRSAGSRWKASAFVLAGALPALLLYAGWQYSVSGHFGVMPWQGGYSLWAANGPGVNGRYYIQKSALSYEGGHQNPARLESEALYRSETGTAGEPLEIDRYWREKTKREIAANPGRWIRLEFEKLYFFLNDFEQYNNKTYSFHKAASPILSWNPLSWGVIFCLAAAGVFALFRLDRKMLVAVSLISIAYLAGGLLVFAGDRFRYPLVPFAALMAGGCVLIVQSEWRQWEARRRVFCAVAVAAAAVVSFSRFAGVHDISTYTQDRLLMANTCLRAGHDAEARAYVAEVLNDQPGRPDAQQIGAAARFNQHLDGSESISTEQEWRELADQLGNVPSTRSELRWMQAIANWNGGREESSIRQWRDLIASGPPRVSSDSLAMLVLSDQCTDAEKAQLLQLDWRKQSPYVWIAFSALVGPRFDAQLLAVVPSEKWGQLKAAAGRLIVKR